MYMYNAILNSFSVNFGELKTCLDVGTFVFCRFSYYCACNSRSTELH